MAKVIFGMNVSLDGYVDHQAFAPDATLVVGDIRAAIRRLKDEHVGEIEVGEPELAHSLTALGLIDEYLLYLHPVVLGGGKPFFAGLSSRVRLAQTSHQPCAESGSW